MTIHKTITKIAVVFFFIFLIPANAFAKDGAEIIWDKWGIPHIYADNKSDLFYGQGWAMAKLHGNLSLKLYGESRGRGAEYQGAKMANQDRLFRKLGLPTIGKQNFKNAGEHTHTALAGFTAGFNAFIAAHSDKIKPENLAVFPVMPEDIMAHYFRIFYVEFAGGAEVRAKWPAKRASLKKSASAEPFDYAARASKIGSNTWAVGPKKSASGNAMLLANPHLPWFDFFMFYESHLVMGETNFSGINLVGFPGIVIGFNKNIGWSHTVNVLDNVDRYDLTKTQGGYLFDGKVMAFNSHTETMKIKQKDGSFKTETITIKSSIHGAVVKENDTGAMAIRFPAVERAGVLDQYWDMMNAQNLTEFKAALNMQQIPFFNAMYADSSGDIYYISNGFYPKRKKGDFKFWNGLIPGDNSAFLWTETYDISELPQITNPALGAMQNSNDSPWSSTIPMTLRKADYPDAFAGAETMTFRPQHSTRMLMNDDSITFDEMHDYQQSTHLDMADHVLDEMIPLAERVVRKTDNALLRDATKVLKAWDRKANADSKGAVLFMEWLQKMDGKVFSDKWSSDNPWDTPTVLVDDTKALKALTDAGQLVVERYGKLDVPYGDIYRMKVGNYDEPGSGQSGYPGSFRVLAFQRDKKTNLYRAMHGDTYVSVMEFSKDGVKAKGLLSYGNSSEDGSPHKGDQLPLFAKKQWRDIYLDRADIVKLEKSRETLKP